MLMSRVVDGLTIVTVNGFSAPNDVASAATTLGIVVFADQFTDHVNRIVFAVEERDTVAKLVRVGQCAITVIDQSGNDVLDVRGIHSRLGSPEPNTAYGTL
jgi:hypothetical protein